MIEIFTQIGNAVGQVIEFFKEFFEIITIAIQFIPQPFFDITLMFLPILIASIIFKVVKGVL